MVCYMLQLVVALGLATPPPVPFDRLPTPDEVRAGVDAFFLDRTRSMLTWVEELRKSLERSKDANKGDIEFLRKMEAELEQEIAALEAAKSAPRPSTRLPMSPGVLDPFDPANKVKKPPVRD